MSWDATLYRVVKVDHCPDCGHELSPPRTEESELGWWNTTHNVAPMIYRALEAAGIPLAKEETWWQRFSGMTAGEGREYLSAVIVQLEADPERFQAMNPPNGWGSYDGLLEVLREMRDASAEAAGDGEAVWHASG